MGEWGGGAKVSVLCMWWEHLWLGGVSVSFAVISNTTCHLNSMADCHATATMKTSRDDQLLMKGFIYSSFQHNVSRRSQTYSHFLIRNETWNSRLCKTHIIKMTLFLRALILFVRLMETKFHCRLTKNKILGNFFQFKKHYKQIQRIQIYSNTINTTFDTFMFSTHCVRLEMQRQ